MNTRFSFDQYLLLFTTFLALVVVLLGAFCRLADAGLGCPDWPGCYGHLLSVPQTLHDVHAATVAYPNMPPLAPERMWPEMIHRYFAGTLGLCVGLITVRAWINKRRQKNQGFYLSIALILLVCCQAILGMWTVTWKLLPLVVMGHLLGGFVLTSLLWWMTLSHWPMTAPKTPHNNPPKITTTPKATTVIALMSATVFLQILLGGWTSTNYAALICPTFPFCHGTLLPAMALAKGFNFISPIGQNYEFGLLGEHARIAIQMVHRWGALLTTVVLLSGGIWLLKRHTQTRIKTCVYLIFFSAHTTNHPRYIKYYMAVAD